MINVIPILGWIISFAVAFIIAIPTYFLWNGMAPTYFAFLPEVYLSVPYWDIVWIVWLTFILKFIFVPKFNYPTWPQKKQSAVKQEFTVVKMGEDDE